MTSSRRSFLKFFGTGAAAIVVAPYVSVPETDAVEASNTVVEPPIISHSGSFESHSSSADFQRWLADNHGPVMVKYGVFCFHIPAGFTVAEIREKFIPSVLRSNDVEAWKGLIRLNDDYIVNDGYFEFIRVRIKEKGI